MQHIEFYSDYRQFLKEYYEDHKKRYSFFSYRYFCQKSGISSPALFKEVVSGHRNLTPKTTEMFVKGLNLTEQDARYFRLLVQLNQSENELDKIQILENLRGLRKKIDQKQVPLDLYEYYMTWYYPVIRELACLSDWHEDFRSLARSVSPPIKKSEARSAIDFLVKRGFLTKDTDGRYHQSDPAITTGSEVTSVAIRSFNEVMAQKGVEAIRKFPPSQRDIRTVIAGISDKSYPLIKEEIREFIARVVRIVDDDKTSNRAYSLNLQLFPVSQDPENGASSDEEQ